MCYFFKACKVRFERILLLVATLNNFVDAQNEVEDNLLSLDFDGLALIKSESNLLLSIEEADMSFNEQTEHIYRFKR